MRSHRRPKDWARESLLWAATSVANAHAVLLVDVLRLVFGLVPELPASSAAACCPAVVDPPNAYGEP